MTGEQRAGQHLAGALSGAGLSAAFAFFGLAFLGGIYVWGIVMNRWSKMLVMAVTISGIFVAALALALMNHTAGGGNRLLLLGILFAVGVAPGVGVSEAASPRALALDVVGPNPFFDETSIRFTLPRAGDVKLDVIDLAGRRVVGLLRGRIAAGDHATRWAGRDANGRRCATGIYFLRLSNGTQTVTRRLAFTR